MPTVPSTPGQVLRGFRMRDGLTQSDLARVLGLSMRRLSRMERGLEPIPKPMAKRLAGIFQERSWRVFA